MNTPECSYWITIYGPAGVVEDTEAKLMQIKIVAGNFDRTRFHVLENGKAMALYDIKEDFGTISQWLEMDTEMAKLAAAVPDATITVEEIDEETHNFHRKLTYQEGKLVDTLYGRTLGPEEFDRKTVKESIRILKEAGYGKASKVLETLLNTKN